MEATQHVCLLLFLTFEVIIFRPAQECQKIFPAKYPMNHEATIAKLGGLGAKILENVDPNPSNFVAAGIIHTQAMQIGSLIRLEPNTQANVSFPVGYSNLKYVFRCIG